MIQIDLSKPLSEQGHFDAILQKVTDLMMKSDGVEQLQNFKVFFFGHFGFHEKKKNLLEI